jgi:hypothetical protein
MMHITTTNCVHNLEYTHCQRTIVCVPPQFIYTFAHNRVTCIYAMISWNHLTYIFIIYFFSFLWSRHYCMNYVPTINAPYAQQSMPCISAFVGRTKATPTRYVHSYNVHSYAEKAFLLSRPHSYKRKDTPSGSTGLVVGWYLRWEGISPRPYSYN